MLPPLNSSPGKLSSPAPPSSPLPLTAHLFFPLRGLRLGMTLPDNNTVLGLSDCPPGLVDHKTLLKAAPYGGHLPTGVAGTRVWRHHFPSKTLVIQHPSFLFHAPHKPVTAGWLTRKCFVSLQEAVCLHTELCAEQYTKNNVTPNLICLHFP